LSYWLISQGTQRNKLPQSYERKDINVVGEAAEAAMRWLRTESLPKCQGQGDELLGGNANKIAEPTSWQNCWRTTVSRSLLR
jgi:hypothetical protein